MSKEAEKVRVSLGEGVLLGDSSLREKVDRVAILSEEDVYLGNSPPSQQQEITIDHGPNMSIDELLKVIKRANGMPVLFFPSNDDRRLTAVSVDGHQNLVPTNNDYGSDYPTENEQHAFRSWLLLMASLIATVTFTAGLTPPGGFWSDDKAGHVAGTPVMRDKFPKRYGLFQFSNKVAFFGSLTIIGMLANVINNKPKATALRNSICFPIVVAFCIVGLGTSFITGMSSCDLREDIYNSLMLVVVLVNISIPWVISYQPRNP